MAVSQPSPRVGLFIDGPNLHTTSKALGFDIDFKRLLSQFECLGSLWRAFYYTTLSEDQTQRSFRPLVDWLDYNGYTVIAKTAKDFIDESGQRRTRGNTNIELAVDAMALAGKFDHMVLFSGDGDFRAMVEAVQRRGVRVTVVSTMSIHPPMLADELRRQADVFIDLASLRLKLGRNAAARAPQA
ncbi:NYN domain-containing protein [Bradyrhizobium sp. SYSU BS000235]|uniref:LabA-like NYN domain-containing protein n=1 Tax=Bradyrhizobium sp. SYSU BS000235 TaxID=3411332 RepID=UPI003C795E3E